MPIKKGNGNGKKPTCKIKFIGNFRFMSSSLSNLADNLPNGLHNKCTDRKSYLEYVSTDEVEWLIFNCLTYSKNYKKTF